MQLLRKPLFWMIASEVVVVTILIGAAWHFVDGYRHRPTAQPAGVARAPVAATNLPTASARPAPPQSPSPPARASTPTQPITGIPFDIRVLNTDAADWEHREERLAMALTDALRTYVETVVVPAVDRAERVRPATKPATTQSPAAIRNTP